MKKNLITLALIALTTLTTIAGSGYTSDNWHLIGTNHGKKTYVDHSRIKTMGNKSLISLWIKEVSPNGSNTVDHIIYDEDTATYKIVSVTVYDKAGHEILSGNPHSSWDEVVPDTIIDAIIKDVVNIDVNNR